jgi:hypothetical protein
MSDFRETRTRLDEGRDYDPYRLSSPRIVILSMVIFLIIVAFLAASTASFSAFCWSVSC